METEYFASIEKMKSIESKLHERGWIRETYDFGGFLISQNPPDSPAIDLLVMTLVHGNEPGGLQAAAKWLEHYLKVGKLPGRIAVLFCHREAAAKNVRFLEKDLNRCFGNNKAPQCLEERKAQAIENIILRSKYLIDIHQTNYETKSDFFIFPEAEKNISFAAHIDNEAPIITHGLDFSQDGLTSDTFATLHGVTAITYEMGQIGQTKEQIKKTVRLLDKSLEASLKGTSKTCEPSRLLKFGQVVTASSQKRLIPNLINLAQIKKGEVLGHDENQGPITAEHDGYILFPKYGTLAEKSSELCHLLQTV